MPSEKLLPCPFCGGEAKLVMHSPRMQTTPSETTKYSVECVQCHANRGIYIGKENATFSWNARHDPEKDQLRQENERLWELVRLAIEEMKHNLARPCNACASYKNRYCDRPQKDCGGFGGWKWQHADKLKEMGIEV